MPIQTKDLTRDVVKYGLIVGAAAAVTSAILSQTTRQRTPEASHDTSEHEGRIEIREYAPAIAAQVEIEGARMQAIDRGFRILAEFIFGQNTASKKIAMTTPVIQHTSEEKLGFTVPTLQRREGSKWIVEFIMPDKYTLDTLPQPTNPLIAIREIPAKQVAVIRFSGSNRNDVKIAAKSHALETYLLEHSHRTKGAPVLAFYDPPWTLPFLRRNEVMIELETAEQLAEKPTINEKPEQAQKPTLAKKA